MRADQTAIAAPAEAASRPRTAWLDNLRVVLIAGVITAHVATAYIVEVDWYFEDRTTAEPLVTAVTFPVFLGAIFGLGPLFLVAGLLSARSLAARGGADFVRTRLVRLGVPLVFFCLVIDPLADYLGHLPESDSTLWDYAVDRTDTRDFGPMWFVAAVLLFSLSYAAWRAVRPRAVTTDGVVSLGTLAGFAAAIALVSWTVWLQWSYSAETPFNANFGHWGQASVLFVLGVCCGERGWFDTLTWPRARRMGWVAVGGIAALVALAGSVLARDAFDSMAGGVHGESAAFAAIAGMVGVAVSLWAASWFRVRWDHAGPTAQRAGRGSYAAYVIHPVVLVLLSLACAALAWAPEATFLLVAFVGVPATFVIGYGLTRVPGLRRVL
jgi:fucose 4-O-acetylase-like acetyltransferase